MTSFDFFRSSLTTTKNTESLNDKKNKKMKNEK